MATKNLRFIILGGGISGTSVRNLLHQIGTNPEEILLVDSKLGIPDTEENARIYLEGSKEVTIIKSPGIPPQNPWLQMAKSKNLPIVSELDFGLQFAKGEILGITGTDGKSTTTSLTHHILQSSFPNRKIEMGGNIGRAFTSFCNQEWDLAVLELSSYQLEDSREGPCKIAAILNLAPDHLERHGTMENYARAKAKIIQRNNPKATLITNFRTFGYFQPHLKDFTGTLQFFSLDSEVPSHSIGMAATIVLEKKQIQTKQFSYSTEKFPLLGVHNLENLAAAILLSEAYGCPPESIQLALERFQGLPHRYERFLVVDSWEFINDSKATNFHSVLSWLKNYPFQQKSLHLLMGGRPKEEPLDAFLESVQNQPFHLYIFGEAAKVWESEITPKVKNAKFFNTMEEALVQVHRIYMENKKQPSTVILSPGCASFDQYANFEERGKAFQDLVFSLFLKK